jgi:uncharacterized protein YaaW (UPF0174 family)
MNERIEELAEQCYEENSTQIDVYKFAELIVEECMTMCDTVSADYLKKADYGDV